MARIVVKPVKGAKVRNPALPTPDHIPASGVEVEDSAYWRRRERDGVVKVSDPPEPEPKKPAAKPAPAVKTEA